MLNKIKKCFLSINIGFLNGLFGSGGGILAVKYLESTFKDTKKAHASSLLVVLPITIVTTIIYFFNNNLNLHMAMPYIIGGVFGCFVGTKILKKINKNIVSIVFSILILYLSVRLWIK